jgi:parallel beta-helix repeat protein
MKKFILLLAFLITITPAFAVCNITDNTNINSDTTLVANETPCYVNDTDDNGVIIIGANDITLNCGGSWVLSGDSSSGSKGINLTTYDNVTIENCYIEKYYNGIEFLGSLNSTLDNITVNNNTNNGIYIPTSVPNNVIKNINANYNKNGILTYSQNTSLENITVNASTQYGLYIYDCNPCKLINISSNNNADIGIYLYALNNTTLSDSNITEADSNGEAAMYIRDSFNNTIENITLNSNAFGLEIVLDSQNNTITNLTLISNIYGIYISSPYSYVRNINSTLNTYGIYLTSGHSEISNSTFTSNGYGIIIPNGQNQTIENNTLTNNTYNFFTYFDADNDWNKSLTNNTLDSRPLIFNKSIENYTVPTNAGAFYCFNCTNITFENSTLINTGNAIVLWYTNNSSIYNITINNTYKGLLIEGSDYNTVNNLTIDYVGVSSIPIPSNFNSILGFNITSTTYNAGVGFYFGRSNYSTLNNITIRHAAYYGIEMEEDMYSNLTNSFFYNNSLNGSLIDGSLYLWDTDEGYFINNTVVLSYRIGVDVYSGSSYNNFIGNNVSFNRGAAFDVDLSDYNNFTNNILLSNNPNDSGFYIASSNYTRIENNTLTNNTFAITAVNAINNTIHNNTIQNSSNTSIYFYGGSGNHTITNNTICYNARFILNTSTLGNHLVDNNTFCVDAIAPLNNSIAPYIPSFTINASNPMYTDSTYNTSCQFYLGSTLMGTNSSIYNHNQTRVNYLVNTPGVYNWYVYCNDSASTNWGNSSFYFTISSDGGGGGGGGSWVTPPTNQTNITEKPIMNSSIPSNLTLDVNETGSVILNITRLGYPTCCAMINITGIPEEWLLTNLGQFRIEEGETKSINLTFESNESGEYPINIKIITPDINQTLPFKLIILKGEAELSCIKPWWLIIPVELEYPDCYIPTWLIIIPGVLYYGYRHSRKDKPEKKKPSFWREFKKKFKRKPKVRKKKPRKKSKKVLKRKLITREKLIVLDRTHKERISVF